MARGREGDGIDHGRRGEREATHLAERKGPREQAHRANHDEARRARTRADGQVETRRGRGWRDAAFGQESPQEAPRKRRLPAGRPARAAAPLGPSSV